MSFWKISTLTTDYWLILKYMKHWALTVAYFQINMIIPIGLYCIRRLWNSYFDIYCEYFRPQDRIKQINMRCLVNLDTSQWQGNHFEQPWWQKPLVGKSPPPFREMIPSAGFSAGRPADAWHLVAPVEKHIEIGSSVEVKQLPPVNCVSPQGPSEGYTAQARKPSLPSKLQIMQFMILH